MVSKTIPKEKKYRKAKWLSEEALQIDEMRREAKGEGEREWYTQLFFATHSFNLIKSCMEHFLTNLKLLLYLWLHVLSILVLNVFAFSISLSDCILKYILISPFKVPAFVFIYLFYIIFAWFDFFHPGFKISVKIITFVLTQHF